MDGLRVLASGLCFPEGPVAMRDGSVVLVEIERQTVSRVRPDGTVQAMAHTGGGPNGLAVGPDEAFYVCNNGGFAWRLEMGLFRPAMQASDYVSGRIERVDPKTGAVTVLYDRCGANKLNGPNDIVFDTHGGFYFTDLGKTRARDRDHGAIYYALADGSRIVEVAGHALTPNGIGLSPDGTVLYVAETEPARLWAFDIASPGVARKQGWPSPHGGRLIAGLGGYPALRQPGGGGFGQHLRGDAGHRLHQRDRAGRAAGAAGADAGPGDHQYLLRWAGPAHGVRDAVGDWAVGGDGLAGAGVAVGVRRLRLRFHTEKGEADGGERRCLSATAGWPRSCRGEVRYGAELGGVYLSPGGARRTHAGRR